MDAGYGTVALSGYEWLDERAQRVLTHGLPDLPAEPQVRRFNPTEPRDSEGRWSNGPGGGAAGVLKDALKLAEKIDLKSDERLIASSKVDGESGGIRMALIDRRGTPALRIGVGSEGYGKADRSGGIAAWDGNPTRSALSSADRKRLDEEENTLDEEYGSASPGRQKQIDERLAVIREQLADNGFNGTAELDEYSMNRLVDRVRPALAEAVEQEKVENEAWDEIEALKAKGDPDPARLAALQQTARAVPESPGYGGITFAKGSIPGAAWGDVHFAVELDDVTVGAYLTLGVKPKGASDDWGDDKDWRGQFDAAETRKFLRLLDQYRKDHV